MVQTKEEIKQRIKEYHEKNKEKEKQWHREYYQKNKKEINEKHRDYHEKNKKEINEKHKEDYAWNRFEKIIKSRQYYQNNKDKILKRMREFAHNNDGFMNEKRKKHKLKYPEKEKARYLAKYRIQIPENQICVMCNEKKATDRHHEDYSKPLEVKFVCHWCNCKMERCEI